MGCSRTSCRDPAVEGLHTYETSSAVRPAPIYLLETRRLMAWHLIGQAPAPLQQNKSWGKLPKSTRLLCSVSLTTFSNPLGLTQHWDSAHGRCSQPLKHQELPIQLGKHLPLSCTGLSHPSVSAGISPQQGNYAGYPKF